jgi:hypothetical protein
MDHRRLGAVARDNGGILAMGGGVVWEGIKVSHQLRYLRELAENLDWKGIAAHLWDAPLAIVAVGCAWSLGVHLWHRRKDRRAAPPTILEVPTHDVSLLDETLVDTPPNLAEIAKTLKPGDSCEIVDEVVRKRTITLRAGQR